MPVIHAKALIENRVKAIAKAHRDANIHKAEIDVSGGLDSAVVLGLVAQAIGPENIIAVHSQITSDPAALKRAQEVCDKFGVKLCVIDLGAIYTDITRSIFSSMNDAGYDTKQVLERTAADPTILGSIRSTLRAPVGRGFNRLFGGGLRHGTGNECEDRWLRFYQKGGDGEVDSNPIAMLSKGEVYQLAHALGVPASILNAVPTPDLWGSGEAHNDESEIREYLRVPDHIPYKMYSYIDNRGHYVNTGLIERVSRWLDAIDIPVCGWLDENNPYSNVNDQIVTFVNDFAPEFNFEDAKAFLLRCKQVEAITAHKYNPNCPSYGNRSELLQEVLISNRINPKT